jgi:hypothetical protein
MKAYISAHVDEDVYRAIEAERLEEEKRHPNSTKPSRSEVINQLLRESPRVQKYLKKQ